MTIEQFVGCVSGLCLSWCGRIIRGQRGVWIQSGVESGVISGAIIGGEVLLCFAQALRDSTRN
jgi:hypothetical protein